jgi:hypothetical protein
VRNRALLLPALLILIGLLALLVNLGFIPTDRLYRLADLWPLLLIVLGLEVLIDRLRLPSVVEMTASVLVVVVAIVGAAAYVAVGPAISTATQTMTASGPLGDVKNASLEIDVGGAKVQVEGSSSLNTDLFQARIDYSGPRPSVSAGEDGRIVVSQSNRFGYFGRQSIDVKIELNVAVPWALTIHSGASRDTYDLTNLQLTSMEIDTGASSDDISLPHPIGTVPVRINGGALTVHVHRPSGADASVKVSGGAVSLTFDGDRTNAIGSVSHSTGDSSDKLDVSVNGGSCNVTMDTGSALG